MKDQNQILRILAVTLFILAVGIYTTNLFSFAGMIIFYFSITTSIILLLASYFPKIIKSWLKIAIPYALLIMISIVAPSILGHGGGITNLDDLFSITLGVLFLIHSIILIIVKSIQLRKKDKKEVSSTTNLPL